MKFEKLTYILILLAISTAAVSASNDTVTNTHNSDINDTKYVNPNDYYFDENGSRIPYTSDTGSYNNVSMSNGYNAYAIQDGGYIETNDSKTHPSFWNDTFHVVDANDSATVVGHWHYTNKTPIGEYLKILFYNHYDDLVKINKHNPNVPSSIYFQSYIWDFYKNGANTEKLLYQYNKEAVNQYNDGFRVNNTGNMEWLNETAYRIFDFLAFKNTNQFHKDLWGFKIQYFNISANNDSNNESDNDSSLSNTSLENCTNKNIFDKDKNQSKARLDQSKNNEFSTHKSYEQIQKTKADKIDLTKSTGHSVDLLLILVCLVICVLAAYIINRI